jgi:hypothetical protein
VIPNTMTSVTVHWLNAMCNMDSGFLDGHPTAMEKRGLCSRVRYIYRGIIAATRCPLEPGEIVA